MSRSFIHLRRALFGVSCAIVFGFGATQALAEPGEPPTEQEVCDARCQQVCETKYGGPDREVVGICIPMCWCYLF